MHEEAIEDQKSTEIKNTVAAWHKISLALKLREMKLAKRNEFNIMITARKSKFKLASIASRVSFSIVNTE